MDITERKHAEEALRDADRKKDDFIATLAHELRNPLAPIRNAADVLRQKDAADPQAPWCRDVIDRQVTQMSHLLEDLLDVSRMARGQLPLRRERLVLAAVIEQSIEIAQPAIDAAGHRLEVALPAPAIVVDGDLTRLAQVFSNLLINAAKYTPPGGRIALAVEARGAEAIVRVTDTGIGIGAEQMPHIFEMFGQVRSALDRSQGGLGIGLSLARGWSRCTAAASARRAPASATAASWSCACRSPRRQSRPSRRHAPQPHDQRLATAAASSSPTTCATAPTAWPCCSRRWATRFTSPTTASRR